MPPFDPSASQNTSYTPPTPQGMAMWKIITLIIGGVLLVAVLGRVIWAVQAVKSDEVTTNNDAPVVLVATTYDVSVTTSVQPSSKLQSASVSASKETEIQNDLKTVQAEMTSCKSRYGDLLFCQNDNAPLIGIINNCLKYTGDTTKAKDCVMTEFMTHSGTPSISFGSSDMVVNGVTQLSSGIAVDETKTGYTVACVDKNTPLNSKGLTDTSKARKLFATTLEINDECQYSINYGVMCSDVDISPYLKCLQSVTKYGPYKTSKEVDALLQKYVNMLGVKLQ